METSSSTLPFKSEIQRKLIHLLSIFYPILYYYTDSNTTLNFLILSFFIISVIEYIKKKYTLNVFPLNIILKFMRKYEHHKFMGASFMIFGFIVITLFFNKEIVILSMLITVIADSTAALLGMKYGKVKTFHERTLEGSFCFALSAFIIFTMNSITLYLALILSVTIALVELFTKTEYDNLSIPIASSLILYFIL